MYADEHLGPWRDCLLGIIPDLAPFDVHTHTGSNDPDGFSSRASDLITALEEINGRAVVFTMHEPGGYPPANDRVLSEAAASDGRLVGFCRLDPRESPRAEAERCLDAGARGIKLHPRAERFRLDEPETEPIFALANERRVPVLIHAGRGIPALGHDALALAERFPDVPVILAHAGVCDLAWLWRHVPDRPNIFFDTAWWSAIDMLALFALIPPGQILFGSDAPYGTPLHSSLLTMRCALQVGVAPAQLPTIMGGQLARLLERAGTEDLGPAVGTAALGRDILLERVHSYLTTAIGRMLLREAGDEYLGLARLACDVGADAPQAPVCQSVLALLDRFERYLEEHPDPAAEPSQRFPGLHLIVIASIVAMTPNVVLPSGPDLEAGGERHA